MKILAIVHGYFPNHNAGAEAMLHQILVDLKNKGHDPLVLTLHPGAEEYEGIPIHKLDSKNERKYLSWCDMIFTHLDLTRHCVPLSQRYDKPLVHLVHNDKQLRYNKIRSKKNADLVISNSDWIDKTVPNEIPSVVVYPPTIPERYAVKTNKKYIALINMNEAKGGKIFWQLARIFPDKQFLGVKGAYGNQIIENRNLPNVTILENTPNIQEVYKQCGIVLMPSSYESWGRVAMEASCSGIPVIAAPTPGLKESLDYAGIFAEHDNVADWVEAIKFLDNPKVYEKYSKLTKERSKEVADKFAEQMIILEKELLSLLKP